MMHRRRVMGNRHRLGNGRDIVWFAAELAVKSRAVVGSETDGGGVSPRNEAGGRRRAQRRRRPPVTNIENPHPRPTRPQCDTCKKYHLGECRKKWPTVENVAKPTSVAGQLNTQVQENKWKAKAKEMGKQAHEKTAHIGLIRKICATSPDVRQALESVDTDALQPDERAVLAKLQAPPRHKKPKGNHYGNGGENNKKG